MTPDCNFIAGTWVPAHSDAILPVIDPASGERIGSIADSDADDIDRAVKAARAAYDTGDWGRTTALERGRMLTRFSQLVAENSTEIAALESRDTGKPRSVAAADVVALVRYFEFYGAAADKLHGETIPYQNGMLVATVHEPYGVTGHILPWNYPAQMFGRTLAPSLAVGNATVLKPAEDACASALYLAELSNQAGFPPGAINVVTGRGAVAGAALASHPGIDFMSFTGSPEVGQIIQKLCADHYITCTLELGGKSPHVVFADADLDVVVPAIIRAIVQNSGQTCSAGSRVLVERGIHDELARRLAEAFAKVSAGAPVDDHVCGPLISARQQTRVQAFVARAEAAGVPVLARGTIDAGADAGGFYVQPVLFGPVPRDSELAREEVFGPVLAVLPFDDEADAIGLANATDYGLIAAVWTRDGSRQLRLARKIRSGQLFINCYGAGAGIELPFGGTGKSGHGREKGLAAMHDFSVSKTIVIQHG